jgi:hypothetical protein
LNEFCKEKGINYFVTGFYIQDVPAMDYKARFYPHELLIDGEWRKIEKHRAVSPFKAIKLEGRGKSNEGRGTSKERRGTNKGKSQE